MADPIDVPVNFETSPQAVQTPSMNVAQQQIARPGVVSTSPQQPVANAQLPGVSVKGANKVQQEGAPKSEKKLKCMWWFWLIIGLIAGAGLSAAYFLFFI